MSVLQALGYFMDYCNRNAGKPGVTQERFSMYMQKIMNMPEDSFYDCQSVQDVLRKIGF